MALCRITGIVYLPSGEIAARREVTFVKEPDSVTADYLGAVLPEPIRTRTDNDGSIDLTLITGNYYGFILGRGGHNKYTFRAIVPEATTADFADLIAAVDPVEPLPSWLQQVIDARDEARASEVAADVSAGEAADSADLAAALTAESPQSWAQFADFLPYADGKVVSFNGVQFVRDRGANIPGLAAGPGWVPSDHPSPEHFGAVGDGAANDGPALQAWLNYGAKTGIKLFAERAGVYRVFDRTGSAAPHAALVVDMERDMEIELCRSAVIQGDDSLRGPLILLRDTGGRWRYGFTIRGGIFDNQMGVWEDNKQTNSCIDPNDLHRVLIEGVTFLGRNDRATMTLYSDAGITPTNVKNLSVTNCFFYGQQSGIYATGIGGDASGGEHVITGCHFENCVRPMQTKAEVARTIFANNTILDCWNVGFTGIEVADDYPARALIITGNTFKRGGQAILLRYPGPGSIVSGNHIEDFGFLPDGSATDLTARAITLLGVKNGIVFGNSIGMKDWVPSGDHMAIFSQAITLVSAVSDPGPHATDRCFIYGNDIYDLPQGIWEGSLAPLGTNYYALNRMTNVPVPYGSIILTGTSVVLHPSDTGIAVGKVSSQSVVEVGAGLNKDGLINGTRSGGVVQQLNRLETHGNILSLLFNGASVGSLASEATLGLILNGVSKPPSLSVATLTPALAAAHQRAIVYCSNGDAGQPCLAVSDGTNWRRIALGATVSET